MDVECHYCGEPVEWIDEERALFCSHDCQRYLYDTQWYSQPLLQQQRQQTSDVVARVDSGGIVVCAHRGGEPENTMVAFRASVRDGARLLELDIRLTSDGHLVLMHWPVVNFSTNGHGFVHNHTLEEIRALDAAWYHPALAGHGIGVPTLREFLEEFASTPGLMFLLDFKDCDTVRATLALLRDYAQQLHGRIILGSVIHDCNSLLKESRPWPGVPVMASVREIFSFTTAYLLGLPLPASLPPDTIYGFMLRPTLQYFWSQGLVDAVHERGSPVLICGPEMNREERMREAVAMGVDFIMTDRPAVLAQIVRAHQS